MSDGPSRWAGRPLPPAILVDANDGCLAIARSLVARGVEVHVLARPAFAFVGRSRGVERSVLPPLPEGREMWLAKLRELADRGGGVMLSGSDIATELLTSARHELSDSLVSFETPATSHLRLMDKGQLYTMARAAGVRTPWARTVRDVDELEEAVNTVDYPCILKPSLAHVGVPGTRLVSNAEELRLGARPGVAAGVEMLVTEFVPGPESHLEGAVVVRAPDGTFPVAYGKRKVRQYPENFGSGTIHQSAQVPETMAMARRLLEVGDFVGVAGLEAKRQEETGETVLIEINVRVGQGFGLGDACGVAASWRLYACLAGLPLGLQPRQWNGVKAVVPMLEALALRASYRAGELSVRDLLRSYRGVRDLGALDPRDPGPAVALAATMVRSGAARLRARAVRP